MLTRLYTSNDTRSRFFQQKIRVFNSGMSMATLTFNDATWSQRIRGGRRQGGPSSFRIGGELKRYICPMVPRNGVQPRLLQTYFVDDANSAATIRTERVTNVEDRERDMIRDLFLLCDQILRECENSYLMSFLSTREVIERMNPPPPEIFISLHADRRPDSNTHHGRLGLPTINSEVAILLPNEADQASKREVVASYRHPNSGSGLKMLDQTHRSYDPLQYPLLFPKGTDGWHLNIPASGRVQNVTIKEYLTFKCMARNGVLNPIHLSNKLGQQFVVDQYCKMEMSRLQYFSIHQSTIRAELYQGNNDSVHGSDTNSQQQSRIILPSSFTGGERYMHQQCQDAMAIVHKYGKPHLFITMTCNPNWPEIKSLLRIGQTPQDRPDIVSRVFNMKKKMLLEELTTKRIFGYVKARVHVIEFQKRGLPHMHLLVWLANFEGTPEVLDTIMSAEIPDSDDPLHKLVSDHMLHNICGIQNPDARCMEDGKCRRGFPKDFCNETVIDDDGFARLRRRSPEDGGNTILKYIRGNLVTYHNGFVVPYCPYLLKRFDCHINIEYCYSVKSIKYLFNYINKGSDQSTVTIQSMPPGSNIQEQREENSEVINEIQNFIQKRYVGSMEAMWHIFGYGLCEKIPAVERLTVHLPTMQDNSMLMAYFHANEQSELA